MKWTIFLLGCFFSVAASAQSHKIVFDLSSEDTADHSTVLRQFNNVLKAAPDTELEVVCHGNSVYMLVKGKAFFEDRMKELQQKGKVYFRVCANSMRRLGVDKSQLISLAEVVPVAILELSTRQQQGWSYIRAGH
jgi:intracellular sulfur oxidation DsrE/DsrF family protein